MSASFPKEVRMRNATQYNAVFSAPDFRVSSPSFVFLIKNNKIKLGRLGFAIGKKNVKKAVQRNLIKRKLRESFRHTQQFFSGFDVIAVAKNKAAQLEREQLARELEVQWKRLLNVCKPRAST